MTVSELKQLTQSLKNNIAKNIFGKDDVIEKILICLFCGGHILLEDIPGTGKTTLAKAVASSIGCSFKRVQFTPDLLPSDITGISFFSQKESEFIFKKGAVFANILLGDEINRATPKTQSSLLECMEERQVSVDGVTHVLTPPFLVIATQNPIEIQGTFPLPEAQLDRFFMQLCLGYPDTQSEGIMLSGIINSTEREKLLPVAEACEILAAAELISQISVSQDIIGYIIKIVQATRNDDDVRLGASPRGSLALLRASQASAAISGRSYVIPDDVKSVATSVLSHRIITKGYAISQSSGVAADIISRILKTIPVPTEEV